MIRYQKLWETMKKKGVSQYRLINHYGISSGQIDRIKKNKNVSTHTIDMLCTVLNCAVQDIIEFEMDPELLPHLVGEEPAPYNPFKKGDDHM